MMNLKIQSLGRLGSQNVLIEELEEGHFFLSSPRGAGAFHELRRYDTRPLQLNWGPENVHFRKT